MKTPFKIDETRIFILKPSALGDIVHALPLLASLRKSFPSRYIAWGVKEKFSELLEKHPYLDEVIVWKEIFLVIIKPKELYPMIYSKS